VKPLPRGICPTCDRLWRDYAQATAALLTLVTEGQQPGFCRDEAKCEALAAAYVNVAHTRSWTRGLVHEHQAAAHEHIEVGQNRMLRAGSRYSARMN
jgi:hypothetical protein